MGITVPSGVGLFASATDPSGLGLTYSYNPMQAIDAAALTANAAYFFRAFGGATITKIALWVGTQSGNIDVGVCRNAAAGSGAPATRVISSGSVACPSAGYAEVSLGGSVTVDPRRDYLTLAVDNATATFFKCASPGVNAAWLTGLGYRQTTAFPIPASPSASVDSSRAVVLVGRP